MKVNTNERSSDIQQQKKEKTQKCSIHMSYYFLTWKNIYDVIKSERKKEILSFLIYKKGKKLERFPLLLQKCFFGQINGHKTETLPSIF